MKRPAPHNKSHQENSGWTANSDLFMAIAIVFLIMFVFALLASGASQIALQKDKLEAQKHLLGKLPEADKIKTEKQMAMAAKDLQDISQKREMLKMSLTQLAQMAETLESRESTLKNFYETQNTNIAKIEQSRETIEKQVEELEEQKRSLKATQSQLQQVEREAAEKHKKMSLSEVKIAALERQNAEMKEQSASLSQETSRLKAELAKTAKSSQKTESQNQELDSRVADLKAALEALQAENKTLKGENGSVKKQLSAARGEADKAGQQLKDAQGKIEGLQASNGQLGDALKAGQGENKGLKAELGGLQGKMSGMQKKIGGLEDQVGDLGQRLAGAQLDKDALNMKAADLSKQLAEKAKREKELNAKLADAETFRVACEEEKAKNKGEQQKFAQAAKGQKDKLDAVARTLAEARKAVQDVDNERKRIATNIVNNLKSSGVAVDINPETGNITLRMDESFYFTNASYQLRDEAKAKIAQIMPIYAKSLLENPKIAQRIESILVTGYASPKFNKEYIDPATASGEAYDYNLDLSVNRAREIVSFMFSSEIKDYSFKDKMRSMVSLSGIGMMKAIPLESDSVCSKDPHAAQKFEECTCGPYDCKKSRRVELQFVLKNQKDADRQLQKISDKLIEKEVHNDAH